MNQPDNHVINQSSSSFFRNALMLPNRFILAVVGGGTFAGMTAGDGNTAAGAGGGGGGIEVGIDVVAGVVAGVGADAIGCEIIPGAGAGCRDKVGGGGGGGGGVLGNAPAAVVPVVEGVLRPDKTTEGLKGLK